MKRSGPLRRFTPLRARPKILDPDLRRAVLERDGGCRARMLVPEVRCFGRLHVHHVRPRGRGGKDRLDNLAMVCVAHHAWIHDGEPARARTLGLLR